MIVAIASVLGAWFVFMSLFAVALARAAGIADAKEHPSKFREVEPPAEDRGAFKRWGSAIETAIEDASRSSRRCAPRTAPSSRR